MFAGELTPVFHFVDLEVTSGATASSACLRGNGNWNCNFNYSHFRKWAAIKSGKNVRVCVCGVLLSHMKLRRMWKNVTEQGEGMC